MTSAMKTTLLVLGALTAVFVLAQVVLGQLILGGRVDLVKTHQHTGYTAVGLAVVYVALSLRVIASIPARTKA